MKAQLCTDGNKRLYSYCQSNGIAHNRLGKLIVQGKHNNSSELENLYKNARKNFVDGIRFLNKSEIEELEPEIDSSAALF